MKSALQHGVRGGWAVAGADLDPQEVLHALEDGMPLSVAVPTLERMLRERMHRARQGTVLKHLHRACHLSTASERAEVGPQPSLEPLLPPC